MGKYKNSEIWRGASRQIEKEVDIFQKAAKGNMATNKASNLIL